MYDFQETPTDETPRQYPLWQEAEQWDAEEHATQGQYREATRFPFSYPERTTRQWLIDELGLKDETTQEDEY